MANLLLIRSLSKERNITIRELANRVGITDAALQALIKNGSTNTSTLERIAKALSVNAGYFFGDSPECPKSDNATCDLQQIIQSQQETISNLSESIKLLTSKFRENN